MARLLTSPRISPLSAADLSRARALYPPATARRKRNAGPSPTERAVIEQWAAREGLVVGGEAFLQLGGAACAATKPRS